MRLAEKQLRRDLEAFVEKMRRAGIDVTTIKKPTDAVTSIGKL